PGLEQAPAGRTTLVQRARATNLPRPGSTQDAGFSEFAFKQVWGALARAQNRYRPRRKFDGRIALFKATEEEHWAATVFDDSLFGWESWVTGSVEVRLIPGAHLEMFEDRNVEVLARELKGYVQDAQAPSNGAAVLQPV